MINTMFFRTAMIFLLLPCLAFGFVKPLSVELDETPRVDRWSIKSPSEVEKIADKAKEFITRAAMYEAVGDWDKCVINARKVPNKSVVRDWIWLMALNCSRRMLEEEEGVKNTNVKALANHVAGAISDVEHNHLDWHSKPLASKIQLALVSTKFSLCRWYEAHALWKELRGEIQKLFKEEFSLSKTERAQLYFFAGELLVAERQWGDALWQFDRSRDLVPDPSIDSKIKAVLPMLPANVRTQFESKIKPPQEAPVPLLNMSTEEAEFFNQAQGYLARNDLLSGVEAMAKLIRKFPLGVKSKWAQDKIFEILAVEIEKSRGPQGISVAKKRIENEMLDFDADHQLDWGKSLFDMQAYGDAAPILKKAADQLQGSAKAARPYFLAARAFQLSRNYSEARKIYQHLIKSYPTAPEVVDGAIQWGLIDFNENDPSEAITHLEVARSRKMTSQQDLVSLFWLFQSYKAKNAQPEILRTARDLMTRFALTYYGLIAAQEIEKRLPEYEKAKTKVGRVFFSQGENLILERARALLGAGMLDAASDELSVISSRTLSIDESQYLSNFYAQALRYQKSFGLLSSVIDTDPTRRDQAVVKLLFPKEYWELVTDEKRRAGVDPLLLLSIIKQESAFYPAALSRSGAVGLMQMIPPTGDEVNRELGAKADIPKDLYDPATNVKFCAYYYSHLLKKYNNSVPIALAAYNAGPTRISQFIASQGQLKDTWVDEMPWAETSFYVKSILKNYVAYRMLYKGMTQLPTPPWTNP